MKTRHLSDSINFTGLYFSPLLTVARWLMNCQQLPAFTRRHITLPMTLFCILNFIFKNCALILINMQNTSLVLVVLSWPVTAHGESRIDRAENALGLRWQNTWFSCVFMQIFLKLNLEFRKNNLLWMLSLILPIFKFLVQSNLKSSTYY